MLDIRTGKELSRRDFGKGIAAILAAGCAPSVMGGMMRNTGGAMTARFGGGVDYVSRGLRYAWDCQKSQYSSSDRLLRDLNNSNVHLTIGDTAAFSRSGISFSPAGSGGYPLYSSTDSLDPVVSFDLLYKCTYVGDGGCLICSNPFTSGPIQQIRCVSNSPIYGLFSSEGTVGDSQFYSGTINETVLFTVIRNNGTIKTYVNGTFRTSYAVTSATGSVGVGGFIIGTLSIAFRPVRGVFYAMRCYDVELTHSEVMSNYKAYKRQFRF